MTTGTRSLRKRPAKEKAIPDHVAAYAAGLRMRMSWQDVAATLEVVGFGAQHFLKLAAAAQKWEREHLDRATLARVRKLGFETRHPGRRP